MDWTLIWIVGGVIAVAFVVKRISLVSPAIARQHLRQGALVVDVRSAEEFSSGHLASALNIPLDEIETALPRRVQDKNQVLLLHCLSGVRSGIAKNKVKRLGYTHVFNLGSLARARKLTGQELRANGSGT